ncbi:MAG: FAD-dependent oxidoreductase [Caulobacteraceae bacterium]
MTPSGPFDLVVIGAGVIGLAHAYMAAKAGKRVAVIERDVRANGASVPQLRLRDGDRPGARRQLDPRPAHARRLGRDRGRRGPAGRAAVASI